ncbi:MAG: DUF6542 domain-containing protein [Actinomycetes bacterium]
MTITSGDASAPRVDAASPPRSIGASSHEPAGNGISVVAAPAPTDVPALAVAAPEPTALPAPRPDTAHESPEVEPSLLSPAIADPAVGSTTTDDTTTTDAPLSARLRAALPVTGPGLTGLGGVLLGTLVVGLGALLDAALGGSLGLGFRVTFVLGCVLVAMAVRIRALATAAVLPPLLFAGSAYFETRRAGLTHGYREAALDAATTLALSAPVLYLGTAVALAIVLVRLVVHAVRR